MTQIVVFDTETTGIGSHHRVLEIAGVVYDTDYDSVVGEFETLVNPQRSIDADATAVHGISAEHLSTAPTFEEIAPWLARLFDQRIAVAHNVNFDITMMNREFQRVSQNFQLSQFACTMRASGNLKLSEASKLAGHRHSNSHSALADARAALAVASHVGWSGILQQVSGQPHYSGSQEVNQYRTLSRAQIGLVAEGNLKPLDKASEFAVLTSEEKYLALLDSALSDLSFSEKEIDDLAKAAQEYGFDEGNVYELNCQYLAMLERAALRDGRITDFEMKLISRFSSLLGVTPSITVSDSDEVKLSPNSLVCATGEATIDGEILRQSELGLIVEQRGYRFTDKLAKREGVSLLLIPSYGHMSSKTRNAHSWGIPTLSVEDFLRDY